jgi:2-oxoglutarate dehydrogenase E2 component (dihydrolipoamide succinyltransferase)
MAVEIKVPDMGESVIEATVMRWIKHEGDPVAAGEAVVELETDKVSLEVGAQQAGILQGIQKQEGDTVAVGDVLAFVAVGSEAAPQPEAANPPAPAEKAAPGNRSATPLAQRVARNLGVDLAQVKPGSAGGKITKEDVQAYAASTQPPAEAPAPAAPSRPAGPMGAENRPETRQRMSRRRQTIARRLVEAQQTAAMLTTFNEIDMSAVMDLRKRRREAFKERYGVDLGFMSFFVKATIGALKAFPNLNAEIQGDEIVLKHYYDIGVAVGAEEGLVVPVIRDADRLNFAGIEKAIREFVSKINQGTLSLDDLRGGTFTITNGGIFGSLMSTPILNPPQVGILGMHKIQERPVVVNGAITIRPMMYVALSYDHRLVDGREAVQFLVRLKELVEDPEALLFG